jgi:Na+/H+ antiporter NhaD/arsenite permease-like protein
MSWLLAAGEAGVRPGLLWIWPFALLLLCIAILPLLRRTEHWWHQNRNKLLVSVGLGLITLVYYQLRGYGAHGAVAGLPTAWVVLLHALEEYVPFMALLFALYVVCGGILVRGDLRATPAVNTAFLAIGGLAASFVGTTGASMVLIRPLLNTNRERRHVVHTVVFFIFVVSNIGGSLLPIGDPPLFLGYLAGVPFLWTLRLAPHWAVMLGVILLVHYVWDRSAYARETLTDRRTDGRAVQPLRLAGTLNFVWLIGIVLVVALLPGGRTFPGTNWVVPPHLREVVMLAFVGLSLVLTPRELRRENEFNYVAIAEVAALFIGIFITMQVPIEILHSVGPSLADTGFVHPWQYFWATGLLSSALDNAPTYKIFFETANQLTHTPGPGIIKLVTGDLIRDDLLIAISCGAVFMGANTYIGNGPNFMVKAIAEHAGVRMPSFFGFMIYSALILGPLYVLLTLLFFRPF